MPNTTALSIGMLAERTGCNVPTIRYYEEIGLIPPAVRNGGGHRVYADMDLRRLLFIRRCRDFGFSIDQVRALVALTEDGSKDCMAARDLAQEHLDAVREKLREMRALEKSLVQFVASCDAACVGGPTRECVILEDLASPASSSCACS